MATSIQPTDPLLANLQANILKGHGRNFAHHLFIRFKNEQINNAKAWIGLFAATSITSARQQLTATEAFKAGLSTDGGTIFTLSLTSKGYDKLGKGFLKPASEAFRSSMSGRSNLLNDVPGEWEEGFTGIDAFIIVADDDAATAKAAADKVLASVSAFAVLLLNQRGNVLKTKSGIGIEHFGYADGISQPLYLSDDIAHQPSTIEWDDATDQKLLLVADPGGDRDDFGSFLVFRKLEQNVKGFRDAEGDNPPAPGQLPVVKDVDGNDNDELAGAMIVGRFENGTPVIKSSVEVVNNPPRQTNDFNFANDTNALKCPFHSHIRLMNPRQGDLLAGDVRDHRITRRGIPYDEVNRIPEDRITSISDDLLDKNQPVKGVGLLFMCYQSSIESQFEILQAFWANKGQIGPHITGAQDSLIGQGTNPPKTLPAQWGQPLQTAPFSFSGFVKMKGGEYFFTPSISFLKGLGTQ